MKLKPIQIGPLEIECPVVLAPMAGVTNAVFRDLCRSHGAGLYVSEMIAARGLPRLVQQDQKHDRRETCAGPRRQQRPADLGRGREHGASGEHRRRGGPGEHRDAAGTGDASSTTTTWMASGQSRCAPMP